MKQSLQNGDCEQPSSIVGAIVGKVPGLFEAMDLISGGAWFNLLAWLVLSSQDFNSTAPFCKKSGQLANLPPLLIAFNSNCNICSFNSFVCLQSS